MSTIFKKVIDREVPADIVYEDEQCLGFRDINPAAPLHILVIPKKEICSIANASAEDEQLLGHLMIVAAQIAREQGYEERGYRLAINTNEDGGQTVYHLHLHLLAGRPFDWPPG